MENRNMMWKPELVFGAILAKTDFLGFSRANMSVAMGLTRPIFGAVSYVWELNIRENFKVIAQWHHKFVRWELFGIFGVVAHVWGGRLPPTWPLRVFWHYILRSTAYETGEFRFSGPFSFGDMKVPTLSFVQQWQCQHRACQACGNIQSEPENRCHSYALFRRFVTR